MPEHLDLAAVLDEAIRFSAAMILSAKPGGDLTELAEATEGLAEMIRLRMELQTAAIPAIANPQS